jgi:Spy/CpxP family protein refolding chaperone
MNGDKNMKKFRMGTILAFAVVLSGQLMVAQQGMAGPGGASPDKQEMLAKLQHISQELQLTPQQKQQIFPILKQEVPKLEEVKGNTSLGPLQKAMQLKQISNATDLKIMPILNPQQQQKYQAMREQERQQMIQKLETSRQ